MTRHHRTARAIALAFALTATFAPVAWADPQPLAKAESAIAASHGSAGLTVRPNPDEQTATRASTNTGPCSEVCSAGGYGTARATAWTPDESGPRLPHDPRPRWVAARSLYSTPITPPAVVRLTTPSGGFDWGDAGIGAGGMLALTLIGLGGTLTVTHRRNHRIRNQHAH